MLVEIFPGKFVNPNEVLDITWVAEGRWYKPEISATRGRTFHGPQCNYDRDAIEACRQAAARINHALEKNRQTVIFSLV